MAQRTRRGLYDSAEPASRQRTAFRNGEVPVAVYGLGKMGLPLAAVYAETCGNVTGVDIDDDVVAAVNDGRCPVDREPGLPDLVAETVATGALSATTETVEAAERAAVHVVIVPTLIDDYRQPDLSTVRSAVQDVALGLDPGDLVVVESTVPPGTCAYHLEPQLERESDLAREEFGLAFCPERTSSGRALQDVRGAHPKVVGGVDPESTRTARLLYEELVDNEVLPVSDATTAEAVKVFEGVYRDVNIALANELGRFTDELGIDVREAVATANTQPYCDIHDPGPGVGGHCIPYYPYFLLNWLDTDAPLLRTAREGNDRMPQFVVEHVREGLRREGVDPAEATVLVLGLTYRAGVRETRASPAHGVCAGLNSLGADVLAVDPLLSDAEEFAATMLDLADVHEATPDAAVLVTPHEEFDAVDWTAFEEMVVVDGHDALDLTGTGHRHYVVGGGWR